MLVFFHLPPIADQFCAQESRLLWTTSPWLPGQLASPVGRRLEGRRRQSLWHFFLISFLLWATSCHWLCPPAIQFPKRASSPWLQLALCSANTVSFHAPIGPEMVKPTCCCWFLSASHASTVPLYLSTPQ